MKPARLFGRIGIGAIYLFLLAPLLVVVISSFNASPFLSFPPKGLSLDWYSKVFEQSAFAVGFQRSLTVASTVALVDILIGVPAALALVRGRFPGRDLLITFFTLPMMMPAIILALGAYMAFVPLKLAATATGLVLAHMVVTMPYVIRTTTAALGTLDQGVEEAAQNLGASPWQTFRRITLPLALPGVLAGGVIAFLLSFDELVLTLFLAGPRFQTLPVTMFRYVESHTDPLVAALSTMLVLLSVVCMIVIERAVGLATFAGTKSPAVTKEGAR